MNASFSCWWASSRWIPRPIGFFLLREQEDSPPPTVTGEVKFGFESPPRKYLFSVMLTCDVDSRAFKKFDSSPDSLPIESR